VTGWRKVQLKRLVSINERALDESTAPDLTLRYVDIAACGRGRLVSEPEILTFGTAPSRARRLVRPGDTIVSTVRTYLRAVWPVTDSTSDLVVSTAFAVLTPRDDLDPRFLGWLAQSDPVIEEIVARSVGVGYPAINGLEIGEIEVRIPGVDQQRVIAEYLDREISTVDRLVWSKQRFLDLLRERTDSVLLSLIGTSGLVAGMSGAATSPLRRHLAKLDRPPEGDAPVITAFRDGQVTARALRRSEGFTESWTDEARLQGVRRGDVVIHGLDGFAGAIGTSEADGVCSPIYHVCRPRDGGDAHYFGRLLRLLATTGYLGNFATSTRERAVDFRNWDLFGRIPIPVVPVAQQSRIGAQIRGSGPIREAILRSVGLLSERRRALISAAVTGQVEISGVAA
jgi:type I restriction enzyme S subunit